MNIKLNKKGNFGLISAISLLYVVYIYKDLIENALSKEISYLFICIIYFFSVSIFLKKIKFMQFTAISSVILVFFLSFTIYRSISISNIVELLKKDHLVTVFFSFILLPGVFFAINGNHYILPHEIYSITKRLRFIFVIIPILIKKELIVERFNSINECLYSRGVNIKGIFSNQRNLFKWVIPLGVTAFMEGAETAEYNQMLSADFRHYVPDTSIIPNSIRYKILFLFISLFLLAKVLLS